MTILNEIKRVKQLLLFIVDLFFESVTMKGAKKQKMPITIIIEWLL